jgi:hypothetical protein
MKHILFGLTALLWVSAAQAQTQAQTVYKYDANTIDSSIKCELGQVARMLGKPKPGWPAMKVNISVTGTETITKKVGGGVGIFADIGASYETTTGRTRGAKGERNIHVDNTVNCKKSFVVDVGVLSCFKEQKALFLAGQTISCSDTSSASSAANAGGKFVVWVLNVNVSGALTSKRDWKFDIAAPPDKKPSGAGNRGEGES